LRKITVLQIVVMAAGKGTRMRSKLPKVLQPLAGRALLAHVLDTARSLKPDRMVIVHGYGAAEVRTAFPEPDLLWALQDPPQGTGHAVQMAAEHLADSGTTVILSGDVPLIRAGTIRALADTCGGKSLALLSAFASDPGGLGRIVRGAGGVIERIMEEKDAKAAGRADVLAMNEIYTGVLAAPSAWLKSAVKQLSNDNAQNEYYLTDVIAMARADGLTLSAAQPVSELEWQGMNDKAQLAALERAHQREIAQTLMIAGTTLIDPARIDVRGSLTCGADVLIDVGCVFEGNVNLGDGVVVGAHCVLRNATIGAGTQISPFTHIDSATCGENAKLGPYARIRPGTTLADEVHIGNFTEVKNSEIGVGSKANHLAYIGDATIGARVNVGAGTITCNYDGANKFRTTIEDDVFIGSDTQLIAPVTVGKGATIGAGTTLTKNAPENALTLTRVKQITLTSWKRPVKQKKG
jgi:bifunctional UDP-N-acetylglucosamine pyrophosphorylase / glucosamine-1-phosphate N-acetyltransferase